MTDIERCGWVNGPLYAHYHDTEWGVPIRHNDRALFERLCLEGAQAGLSWITILRKRDHYRRVFDQFDPEKIARYDDARIAELLADPGIVRNRVKIEAAIGNARAYLDLRDRVGSFSDFLWGFVDGRTIINRCADHRQCPTETPQSRAMSRALRASGFRFCGPTICYALMQAVGMVNDHEIACFRHSVCTALAVR